MLWLIGVIVIGFLAGLVARLIMPGSDRAGFIVTTGIGIAGAFIANLIGQALGIYGQNDATGFIGSVIGAVLLLAGYRLVRNRQQAG